MDNLDNTEALLIPTDLEKAFKDRARGRVYFDGLSRSGKRNILHWQLLAKQPATAEKRIMEIEEMAVRNEKLKQFRGAKKTYYNHS